MDEIGFEVMPRDQRAVATSRGADTKNFFGSKSLDFLPEVVEQARPVAPLPVDPVVIEHVMLVPEQNPIVAESLGRLEEFVDGNIQFASSAGERDDQYRFVGSAFNQNRQNGMAVLVHADPAILKNRSQTAASSHDSGGGQRKSLQSHNGVEA